MIQDVDAFITYISPSSAPKPYPSELPSSFPSDSSSTHQLSSPTPRSTFVLRVLAAALL